MDIMYTAMGIILLKTQPLLVFLGLGSSAIAVQIAALAAITLISIAVTIGIVVLMGYGLKKLINPEKIPLANEFVPKKVEIIDTPEIVTARQNLEMAQNTYSKVLVDEQTFRKKSEDLDINYWSYARQRAAKYKIERAEYKIDKAQKALKKLIITEKIKPYKNLS